MTNVKATATTVAFMLLVLGGDAELATVEAKPAKSQNAEAISRGHADKVRTAWFKHALEDIFALRSR